MNQQQYEDVSKKVLASIEDKSETLRHYLKECNALFLQYLVSSGTAYSAEIAASWLKTIKPDISYNAYKKYRRFLFLVAVEAFKSNTQYHIVLFYSDYLTESSLPSEWKKLIEKFVSERIWTSPKSFVHFESTSVGFLTDMQSLGVNNLNEISWDKIVEYKKLKSKRITAVSYFLRFLADRNLIWHYAPALYGHPLERLELYKGRCPDVKPTHSIEEVWQAECMLLKDMNESGYKNTPLCTTESTIESLVLFLIMNDTAYSPEASDVYAKLYIERINSHEYYIKRPLHLLFGYLEGKRLEDMPEPCFEKEAPYPEWFAPYADAFKENRVLNHIGDSACMSDRSALKSLATFLDSNGCKSVTDITRQLLKDFNLADDRHKTTEGKNLYISRIKFFLTFLYDEGYLPEDLGSALSKANGTKVRPTKALTDEQYATVLEYCEKAEQDGNWLDSAVLKIALWTGLRSCDICKLRAEEIDWKRMEFSLIQQKTRVHICRPFPVDVGNAIWMYITECRPKQCAAGMIFCQDKAPYRPLKKGTLQHILHKALPGEDVTFHMLRKTFASRMLRNGAKISDVSDSLGHVSDATVDTYIDTNCEMMRKCALSLDGIEYQGAEL